MHIACSSSRFSAFFTTLFLRSLLCFSRCSFSLSGNLFPRFFTSRYSSQQFFVVLGFALFAKVLGRRVVIRQAHAVVVLPRFAFVAADHSSLRLFFLFIETADAAYVGVFFVIICFCLGLGFGTFAFALARSTFLFTDVSVFRVLAFGCPSGAARFVCKEDVVSFIVPQANTFGWDTERLELGCLPAMATRCTKGAQLST